MSSTKLISSVTSDLVSDQRVHRICKTLSKQGFEVLSLGREKANSLELKPKEYQTKRLKLLFEKGPLFYFEFNLRLFFYLLGKKPDILLSNDLDTLPANALVSLIKRIPLIYDSHEYFTEVPELVERPLIRSIWKVLERLFIRIPAKAYTVSASIANAYKNEYNIAFSVIRNLPEEVLIDKLDQKENLQLKVQEGSKIIIYQGSVNVDRGLEEMIATLEYLPNFEFIILGDGDIFDKLRSLKAKISWGNRIHFLGKVALESLPAITKQGHLGISLEKKNGLSYTYALPNKVFDYIQVGLPVLMSDLPELIEVNKKYDFGLIIDNHDPKNIASEIQKLFENKELFNSIKANAVSAAKDLCWEKESYKVNEIFSDFFDQA